MVAKSTLEYWKRKAAGKLSPSEKRGTPEYFKLKYWTTINQRTVNGSRPVMSKRNAKYFEKGVRLEMTRDEFNTWVDLVWPEIDAIYKAGGTPSIDRKENSGHYSSENIQIVELEWNMAKDREKPVIALLGGDDWKWYDSAKQAAEDGYDFRGVSRAATKGVRHRGAYWLFVP